MKIEVMFEEGIESAYYYSIKGTRGRSYDEVIGIITAYIQTFPGFGRGQIWKDGIRKQMVLVEILDGKYKGKRSTIFYVPTKWVSSRFFDKDGKPI